jgi:hypoxanthine phosphoribosyltransferase
VPASTDRDLWISWDEYHRAIESLAVKVHESEWKFDAVLCLARGGLRPGDVFSRLFGVPLAILSVSSYRARAGTERGALEIASHITMTQGELGGRVLVVDDLVDSGITLAEVKRHLGESFPKVTEVRSAVIWCKGTSKVSPDYCLVQLEGEPWIHQPFEGYEAEGILGLIGRLKD